MKKLSEKLCTNVENYLLKSLAKGERFCKLAVRETSPIYYASFFYLLIVYIRAAGGSLHRDRCFSQFTASGFFISPTYKNCEL